MKKTITIFTILFALNIFNAQTTYVPDDVFEQNLISLGYDDVLDNYVLTSSIEYVNNIFLGGNISDLTGIEDFSSLEFLGIIENSTINTVNLSSNPNITGLSLGLCPSLSNLILANNDALTQLEISQTNLGISNFGIYPNLEYLSCSNNNLQSIDVTSNPALINLSCDVNQISSLDISNNLLLEYLSCGGNNLISVNTDNNINLRKLYCSENQIKNLTINNPNLLELGCASNNMESLNIDNAPSLRYLFATNNNLTAINTSQNTNLESLIVYNNNIESLNVKNNPLLTGIECDNNRLKALDLSNNPNLNYIYAGNNDFSCLSLNSGGTVDKLYSVEIQNNPNLTCVQVDDITFSNENWTTKDAQTFFSETPCPDICGGILKFVDNDQDPNNQNLVDPFISPVVTTNSKSYFYYYVEDNGDTPAVNLENRFVINTNGYDIPVGVKYLGSGILQIWLDLTNFETITPLTISIPNTADDIGFAFNFENIPDPFDVQLAENPRSQSIQVFAGRSIGGSLIEGGTGLGASLAAAKISSEGTAGLNLTFKRDMLNHEWVTRQLSGGVSSTLEVPSINFVLGKIKAGIKTGLAVDGTADQTLVFDQSSITDNDKIAKAAFILESMLIGGIEATPFASIFLDALKGFLIDLNPDLSENYNDYLESYGGGENVSGNFSVGFGYESAVRKNTNVELVEGGTTLAFSRIESSNVKDFTETIDFKLGGNLNLDLLEFKFPINSTELDFGQYINLSGGGEISFQSEYNPQNSLDKFEMTFSSYGNAEIPLFSYFEKRDYTFIVPDNIIKDNYNQDNPIGSTFSILTDGIVKPVFKVGVNNFYDFLNVPMVNGPTTFNDFSAHPRMEERIVSTKGYDLDVKTDLDLALGFGVGLKLGVQLKYLDELDYLKSEYVVANETVLKIAEHNNIPDQDRIFTFSDQMLELFEGLILPIKPKLNELIISVEQSIEDGIDFIVEIGNNAAELSGNIISDGKKWILRKLDPTHNTLFNKGDNFKSEVRKIYKSKTQLNKTMSKSSGAAVGETTLYIVSDNYNISLLDINDQAVIDFDPVTLRVTIDQDKVDQLEFTETEKELAKIYYYDDVNFIWEEVTGDTDPDLNIVETLITKSGNYAVGIAYDTAMDVTAPEIQDYYPRNGNIIQPSSEHWAKLYEPVTGVGIDLSQTMLKIDGVEVEALWNPVEDEILYVPLTPLTDGEHTFEVIVKDLNGNTNSVFSNFTVSEALSTDKEEMNHYKLYPNPTTGIVNISGNLSELESIQVYSIFGQELIHKKSDFEQLDLRSIQSPIVFIKLNSDSGSETVKIILN